MMQIQNDQLQSLSKILDDNHLVGPNLLDWKRNLIIVLTHEKVAYVLNSDPPELVVDHDDEEATQAFEKWHEADQVAKCYILASMSNILQKQHQS